MSPACAFDLTTVRMVVLSIGPGWRGCPEKKRPGRRKCIMWEREDDTALASRNHVEA